MDNIPWYRRVTRWGQTNITEIDPQRYDIAWWQDHWRRTRVGGVIVNAGGIVAYYPSQIPLAYTAQYLNSRDLLGELVQAARAAGLAVLARMDSNRVHEDFAQAHPDWLALDSQGQPYRAGDLYVTSVHSPYYDEYLPEVLREIIRHCRPDGFADNSYSGLGRARIDYSPYARAAFQRDTGLDLPARADWDDPAYRRWVRWSYDRRLAVWDLNNRVTREAGGADCLWIGMLGGDFVQQGAAFRDLKAIAERAEMLLLDSQSRPEPGGFQHNVDSGLLMHNLLGWDKLLPESMAMYEHSGAQPFRVASKPEPEARLWALAGFAGTIQPWWHHIGAYHEDRRQYRTAEPLFTWHAENEAYLLHRRPVAPIGLVWSQENADFYGRDEPGPRVSQPWHGWAKALQRARLPYQPVHADHITRDAAELGLLILPNLGLMDDAQVEAARAFAQRGGSLIASGETSLYAAWGERRADFALADLFGAHWAGGHEGGDPPSGSGWDDWANHTYLRLHPELRGQVDGPRAGNEPPVSGQRHAVLEGFALTDLLPFGGRLEHVGADDGVDAPLSFVPAFPVYPPELAWMRQPDSPWPALLLRDLPGGGRAAYLPAGVDRCYARNPLPDYARLLGNLARWALGAERLPFTVEGPGLLDCRLYRQEGRLVLHLLNLSGTDPRPAHEFLPVGPLRARVRALPGLRGESARLLVAGGAVGVSREDDWLAFTVDRIVDHEVVVIE